jgi:MarR family transcriptional regulator, transcriptional regulator for hemolysin
MTRAQWAVLVKLRTGQGINQRELADRLDLAPITLARLVDKLTASGLVERREDVADRRANRLFLTPKADPILERLDELGEDVAGRATTGLDRREVEEITTGLERIRANLKIQLNSGA